MLTTASMYVPTAFERSVSAKTLEKRAALIVYLTSFFGGGASTAADTT